MKSLRSWGVPLLLCYALMGSAFAQPTTSSRGLGGEMGLSLFSDHKAHRVGDVLTVLIVEYSDASSETKTTVGKEANHSIATTAGQGPLSFIPLMGSSMQDKTTHDGRALTSRSGKLQSKMTAQIVGKTENGDLIIEGRRTVEINGDKEEIALSGIVRPQDVTAENTVYSYHIANAQITYKGKGAMYRGQRPGVLSWLLGWLF